MSQNIGPTLFFVMCSRTRENDKNKVCPMLWDTLYSIKFTHPVNKIYSILFAELSIHDLVLYCILLYCTTVCWSYTQNHFWIAVASTQFYIHHTTDCFIKLVLVTWILRVQISTCSSHWKLKFDFADDVDKSWVRCC